MNKLAMCLCMAAAIILLGGCTSQSVDDAHPTREQGSTVDAESNRDTDSHNTIVEAPHPFATALRAFFEEIPSSEHTEFRYGWNVEDGAISDTSAFVIDLDGNGTMGVVAYKAIDDIDFHRIFYMLDGELRTMDYAYLWFYPFEIGESPLTITYGGEGAGTYYSVYSLTSDGLVVTSELWDFLRDEFHYRTSGFDLPFGDSSLVSVEQFTELLEFYNLNDSRWLPFIRKSHDVRNAPDAYRQDDTAAILAMTEENG